MHLFHRMYHGKTKELVATNEIMQLHVNQKAGKVVPMRSDLYEALSAVGKAHKKLKKPQGRCGSHDEMQAQEEVGHATAARHDHRRRRRDWPRHRQGLLR